MIKIFSLIIFSFLLVNCSFNENSKIWSNKKNVINKEKNVQIILDEKKEIPKELNSKLKLNLSKIKLGNNIFDDYNNFGIQDYSGKFDKIVDFKFSKFNEVTVLNFQPLFSEKSLVFFDKKGSIIKYDLDGKTLWKKIIITSLKKNPIQD